MRGLARLDAMPGDYALQLPRCRSVHTFTMRFPLDLIWLGKDGAPVRVDRDVPPNRMKSCLRARSVVEANAGTADAFLAAGLYAPAPAIGARERRRVAELAELGRVAPEQQPDGPVGHQPDAAARCPGISARWYVRARNHAGKPRQLIPSVLATAWWRPMSTNTPSVR